MFFTFCVKAMPCFTLSTGESVLFSAPNEMCTWSIPLRWFSVVYMVLYSLLFAWYYICPLFERCQLHREGMGRCCATRPPPLNEEAKVTRTRNTAVSVYNLVRRTQDIAASLILLATEQRTVVILHLVFKIVEAALLFVIRFKYFRAFGWFGLQNAKEFVLGVAGIFVNIFTLAVCYGIVSGQNLYSSVWGWGASCSSSGQ